MEHKAYRVYVEHVIGQLNVKVQVYRVRFSATTKRSKMTRMVELCADLAQRRGSLTFDESPKASLRGFLQLRRTVQYVNST